MPIRITHPQTGPRRVTQKDEFFNPYNFVKTPPRDVDGPLGDHEPEGHDMYREDCYTGSIPIVLTTRTPLLLPDQAYADAADERQNQPRRIGTRQRGGSGQGGPLLNGSTVKGVLRSAYEAITNSRYGVISERHEKHVAVRQIPSDVQKRRFKPAVVESGPNEDGSFSLFVSEKLIHLDSDASLDPLNPAPWAPIQLGRDLARKFGCGVSDLDSQQVNAWIHLQKHPARGRQAAYTLWRVSDVVPAGEALPARPSRPPNDDDWGQPVEAVRVRGRLLWNHSRFPVSGRQQKHDERLVVTALLDGAQSPADLSCESSIRIDGATARKFQDLIDSFGRAHANEPRLSEKYGTYVSKPDRWALREGRTLYVEFASDESAEVVGLFPTLIGREPFTNPPISRIDEKHRQATDYVDLSPADRVFGWVNPEGGQGKTRNGHKAKLRVDPPLAHPEVSQLTHPSAEWLGILNGPKAEQYRFYSGNAEQDPLAGQAARSASDGYSRPSSTVRGRKFYLPHVTTFDDDEYWTPSNAALPAQNGRERHREYKAKSRDKPNVQLAVKSWVPQGSVFQTTIWVENLSRTELGALLWLMALPDPAVYGVGLGKPLGFGSVRIDADWSAVRIHSGDGLVDRYRSVTSPGKVLDECALQSVVSDFEAVLDQCGLHEVVRQFLDAAMGFTGAPVHYPRTAENGKPSPPQDELFRWFVENERDGRRHSLPGLGTPDRAPSLPYWPNHQPNQQNRRNQPGGQGQRRDGPNRQHRGRH